MKSPPKLFASISVHSRSKFPELFFRWKNSMLMENNRETWNRIFLPRIAAKLAAEMVPVNPAVGCF